MVTAKFETRFPYLELDVAGELDSARVLTVHDIHGASLFRWLERYEQRERSSDWRMAYARVSPSEVWLEARDQSPTGWFAFTEPREMGGLSYYSVRIVESGKALCFWGIGLLILSAALPLIGGSAESLWPTIWRRTRLGGNEPYQHVANGSEA